MIEVACRYDKPVRIGVNWGSLDQELLARMMDENARRATPWDANAVLREALVRSAIESARARRGTRPARRPHLPVGQGERRAGPDRGVPRTGASLRLPAAPRPDRGRHGQQGHRRVDRGALGAAAGRHRRHDPRVADAGARRVAHARSSGRAGDPADDRAARLHADGRRLPGLRPHDQHLLPGTGRQDPDLPARADAGLAVAVSRRRDDERGRDGLRGERPGREQARQHRHQPAGLRRGAGGAGLHRRRTQRHAEGRTHRRGVPGDRRRLRAPHLRAAARRRPRRTEE